jgi:DNA-binding MarR family transcriptional regulator
LRQTLFRIPNFIWLIFFAARRESSLPHSRNKADCSGVLNMTSPFNPLDQASDLDSRVLVALERVSESFRTLLWQENRRSGLSPIQIQIIVFLQHHDASLRTPGALAREFNMTPATVSDSVKALMAKNLVRRAPHPNDGRSAVLELTARGRKRAERSSEYARPMLEAIQLLGQERNAALLQTLLALIKQLHQVGAISLTRMCFACRNFQAESHYCSLLEQPVAPAELRVDCPEFEAL